MYEKYKNYVQRKYRLIAAILLYKEKTLSQLKSLVGQLNFH